MPVPRFSIVASLPALGGFRRALAVEHGIGRAVVLSFPPTEVLDEPARLDALLRAVEAAGRIDHQGVAAVLGTETVDGALAVVEQHESGTSLRAVLDAAGRTPPDVAVRIGLDVASALASVHAVDAGGVALAHGAVDAERIEVGEGGEVVLCGVALAAAGEAAADLRALGRVLHECLAGEPPGEPPGRLEVPGVPEPLAAAVDRATGAASPAFATAVALAEAIAGAIAAPAASAGVGAYVDAVLPPDEGERAALRRTVEAALPAPASAAGTEAAPAAAAAPARSLDSGQTFPMPAPRRPRSRLPAIVGVIALAMGFAVGFGAQRALHPAPKPPVAAP